MIEHSIETYKEWVTTLLTPGKWAKLTSWERGFVQSVEYALTFEGWLTPAQEAKLISLYEIRGNRK